METIYRDYAPKGVKFYYIYKSLAHPELKGYINPLTLEERFMHVEEAKRTLGSEIPWLVDQMDNQIKRALGDKSNVELIVDPQGRVVHKLAWSDPEKLRNKLVELVGRAENPTRVEDLNMKMLPPPEVAASGVVPRLERPVTGHDYMRPVIRQPQWREGDEPFYAKLRAEADPSLLKEGEGRLWIGFFMDPLYGVHWNNLTDPIRVMIDAPEGNDGFAFPAGGSQAGGGIGHRSSRIFGRCDRRATRSGASGNGLLLCLSGRRGLVQAVDPTLPSLPQARP